MSGFSRLWRCPAAKSRPPLFSAISTGMPPRVRPSMPFMQEDREDPKLGLAAEMLRGRGTVYLKAWGTSMLPSVWPGDLLTIQSAVHDEIFPGDIVLVLRNNRFFVHRLVERRGSKDCASWITRGDAVPQNDPPAATCEMLGRVASIRRANHSFFPSRRLSPLQSAMAWMLSRWARCRNLTLRVHASCLCASTTRTGQFLRSVFRAVRGIPDISPSHTPHQ